MKYFHTLAAGQRETFPLWIFNTNTFNVGNKRQYGHEISVGSQSSRTSIAMDAVRTPWERRAVAVQSPCSRRHQRWRSHCALTALSPRAHRAHGDHSALPLRPHGVPSALSSERRAVAEPRRACFATKLARRHSAFYATPPRLHCDFRALMAIPLRGRCDACAL